MAHTRRNERLGDGNRPGWALTVALLAIVTIVNGAPATAETPGEVAVIGVGETLLAAEVEKAIEASLAEDGLAVVDERGLLAVEELLGDRSGPLSLAVVEALRPHAGSLVLVRVEYLGNRPLYYMERSDATFQSRVIVTVIDLDSGDPGETLVNTRVEYTRFNAERVGERSVRKKLRRLSELVQESP